MRLRSRVLGSLGALLAVIAVVALAGCGTSRSARSTAAKTSAPTAAELLREPSRFVLAAGTSLPGYTLNRDASGVFTNAMAAKSADLATRKLIVGTGRITGYTRNWLPVGGGSGTAALASSASTFATEAGARRGFELGVKAIGASYGTIEVTPPIGARSRVFTVQMDGPANALTLLLIAWQYDRVLATVVATGDSDVFNASWPIGLARQQQQRIAAAIAAAR